MSEFETWWEANWKTICGTSYYFASEKQVAKLAWNAAKDAELAHEKKLYCKQHYKMGPLFLRTAVPPDEKE